MRILLPAVAVVVLAGCSAEPPSNDSPATAPSTAVTSTLALETVQPELFAATAGQPNAWADCDGDGDLDLFVGFRGAPSRLYRQTDGRFEDVAVAAGLGIELEVRAAAWGDYDSDDDSSATFTAARSREARPAARRAPSKRAAWGSECNSGIERRSATISCIDWRTSGWTWCYSTRRFGP